MSFPLSDRVLHDDYLAGLGDRSIAEIRAMRAECEEAEVGVSFARRVLQGHLDIVASELRRRHDGGLAPAGGTLHDLVERLPEILADEHDRNTGPSWRPIDLDPEMPAGELLVAIDNAVGGGTLADLGALGEGDIAAIANRLAELEREFSTTRRRLHERIDELKAELSGRYGRGEISVDGLLS
ncbi:MAG: hypothetical protein AB7W59_11930 [Acidimicrobiia bacterium]